MKKLIVITGPTGSGKTSLSIKLASEMGGEIISADSRQIYKGMNIGTDKIMDTKGIPHHMIDIINPDEEFTAFNFKERSRKLIHQIQNREKTPFLCGGTYFYIQAAVDGLVLPEVPPNWSFRKRMEKCTANQLFQKLKEKDPVRAKSIDKENKRRLIRALEIITETGKPVPELKKDPLPYPVLFLGVKKKRENLYKKINERVEEMIERGLEKEAEKIIFEYERIPRQTIGYEEWRDFFSSKKKKKEVISEIKTHTRQYAKRQMNWFKRDERIKWVKNYTQAKKIMNEYMKK